MRTWHCQQPARGRYVRGGTVMPPTRSEHVTFPAILQPSGERELLLAGAG
eukprot:COSAG02_NODE_61304_length_269_cov_0.600000_1_plen_49_part_01